MLHMKHQCSADEAVDAYTGLHPNSMLHASVMSLPRAEYAVRSVWVGAESVWEENDCRDGLVGS